MARGNWRDGLDRKLLNVLKNAGVEHFLAVATEALSVDCNGDGQLKAQFVGEVCEIVLKGLTAEYLRLTGRQGQLFHSAVLHDLRNPKSEYRTELDTILVTPGFMLTTECKSYGGGIIVEDPCVLVHRGQRSDVYKQSKGHYDKLMLYAQQLVKPGANLPPERVPVFANVFLFSNSQIEDRRVKGKSAIRVTTATDIIDYYEALYAKYREPVFDYERACKIFKKCAASKKLHSEHGEYLGY